MSFLDSRIDIGAIISAITHEHANRAIHLIEQRGNLRAVVDVTTGHRASDNLARDCVQAEIIHPSTQYRVDQLNNSTHWLRSVATEHVLELSQQRRSFLELWYTRLAALLRLQSYCVCHDSL